MVPSVSLVSWLQEFLFSIDTLQLGFYKILLLRTVERWQSGKWLNGELIKLCVYTGEHCNNNFCGEGTAEFLTFLNCLLMSEK